VDAIVASVPVMVSESGEYKLEMEKFDGPHGLHMALEDFGLDNLSGQCRIVHLAGGDVLAYVAQAVILSSGVGCMQRAARSGIMGRSGLKSTLVQTLADRFFAHYQLSRSINPYLKNWGRYNPARNFNLADCLEVLILRAKLLTNFWCFRYGQCGPSAVVAILNLLGIIWDDSLVEVSPSEREYSHPLCVRDKGCLCCAGGVHYGALLRVSREQAAG
jgi:hypothetical protein